MRIIKSLILGLIVITSAVYAQTNSPSSAKLLIVSRNLIVADLDASTGTVFTVSLPHLGTNADYTWTLYTNTCAGLECKRVWKERIGASIDGDGRSKSYQRFSFLSDCDTTGRLEYHFGLPTNTLAMCIFNVTVSGGETNANH